MQEAKQLLLFGASKGGETFIRKNPNQKIVAVADNDPERWGNRLLDIPVINPADINDYCFDEIVITSLWIDSIYPQLVQQLGIPAEKIRVPCKREVKPELPFQHPATLALAHELLIRVCRWLESEHLDYYLDSGTLLGMVRDGDLIAWDDDIDIALNPEAFTQAVQRAPTLYTLLPRATEIDWNLTVHSQSGNDVILNIEFKPRVPDTYIPFDLSLRLRQEMASRSELVPSAGIFDAPAYHFTGNTRLNALGHNFQVPLDYEGFLTFMYGNWREPRKDMALNDYDNRQIFSSLDPRSISIRKRHIEPI